MPQRTFTEVTGTFEAKDSENKPYTVEIHQNFVEFISLNPPSKILKAKAHFFTLGKQLEEVDKDNTTFKIRETGVTIKRVD